MLSYNPSIVVPAREWRRGSREVFGWKLSEVEEERGWGRSGLVRYEETKRRY